MMKTVIEVQGSTDDYEIVVINNNPRCNCQAAEFGGLCKHIIALFTGDFSAVINQDAIKEIEPILASHPALADFQQIDKLQQEILKIEQEILELRDRKLKINSEIKSKIKSIKEGIFNKL